MTRPMDISSLSPLLRLPRELRNDIYDCLFRGSCFKYTQNRIRVTLSYGRSSETSTSLPVWLLTSKQFLKEGLEQFYHTARCTRCSREPNVPSLKFNVETGHYEKQAEPIDNPRRLLSLARIRVVDLKDIKLSTYIAHPQVTPATIYIYDCDGLRFLLQHLLAEGVVLSHLKMNLTLPMTYELLYQPEDWRADLFQIEALARAKRIEIAVQEPEIPAFQEGEIRACSVAVAQLQQELVKAAKSAVAAETHGCTVRNWKTSEQFPGCWHGLMRKGYVLSADDEVTVEEGDHVLVLSNGLDSRDKTKIRRLKTGEEGFVCGRYIQFVSKSRTIHTWHLEVRDGQSAGKEMRIQELDVHTY